MYILPLYIKRYKTKIKADCFVKNIRFNTMYIYDKDGYIQQSNPRGLICRNEKDKTIFLKDRPYYYRASGGVTAVMISDDANDEGIVITSIAYHDWLGAGWFIFALIIAIYALTQDVNPLYSLFIIAIVLFINGLDVSELKRQREFIEQMIKSCENEEL